MFNEQWIKTTTASSACFSTGKTPSFYSHSIIARNGVEGWHDAKDLLSVAFLTDDYRLLVKGSVDELRVVSPLVVLCGDCITVRSNSDA